MKVKLVESSLGVKTTEAMARKIDELLPTLPAELRILKTKSSVNEVELGQDRTEVSTITTKFPDRENEIVLPDGIELADYQANPIVLFGHNQDLPCGRCLWIKPNDTGLLAKTAYPQRPTSFSGEWLPDFVFSMIAAQVLKGKSIGFVPIEIREPSEEELTAYPQVERVITRSVLVEYSCVSCPANPKALVEAINKGLTNLEQWGTKTVRKATKDTLSKLSSRTVSGVPPKLSFKLELDPNQIADEVVKNLLGRWEA